MHIFPCTMPRRFPPSAWEWRQARTFLLAAGDKGKRYSLPNAEIMIHQAVGGVSEPGGYKNSCGMGIMRTKDKLNRILENTGQPLDVITRTDRDNFMSAEEAKEYGIVIKGYC